ncbi:hypothetical protein AAW31_10340 [Nitrosomonas communis]|uniref:Uncharacterized protein n=1 Tax=Nitrosomonas communis TaxID=44574 RepID=A0A0F7KH21_9PROT|nr:hypothetical protein AAW31_10340 [Nitrosomonas communis]
MPGIGKGDLDILSLVEHRLVYDDHASADSQPFDALVLIRVRITYDVLRTSPCRSWLHCRFVAGCLGGSGVLIQRITLATPTQKRLATCVIERFSFSRTDNTLRRNNIG